MYRHLFIWLHILYWKMEEKCTILLLCQLVEIGNNWKIWKESGDKAAVKSRLHQEIISWRNKQRIHTLPVPQLSPKLVYCSSICGRWVGDRVTEFNAWVLTGLGKQMERKRGQIYKRQLYATSYSHGLGNACPWRLRSTLHGNTPSGWLRPLIPHDFSWHYHQEASRTQGVDNDSDTE
jgi:hypothetical protein